MEKARSRSTLALLVFLISAVVGMWSGDGKANELNCVTENGFTCDIVNQKITAAGKLAKLAAPPASKIRGI